MSGCAFSPRSEVDTDTNGVGVIEQFPQDLCLSSRNGAVAARKPGVMISAPAPQAAGEGSTLTLMPSEASAERVHDRDRDDQKRSNRTHAPPRQRQGASL